MRYEDSRIVTYISRHFALHPNQPTYHRPPLPPSPAAAIPIYPPLSLLPPHNGSTACHRYPSSPPPPPTPQRFDRLASPCIPPSASSHPTAVRPLATPSAPHCHFGSSHCRCIEYRKNTLRPTLRPLSSWSVVPAMRMRRARSCISRGASSQDPSAN